MTDRTGDIRIRVLDLTLLILWMNAALDTGKYDDVTVDEVSDRVDDGTIFPFLKERLADAGIMRHSFKPEAEAEITAAMQVLHDTEGVGSGWGIHNNGLRAVIAMANEMVQQGVGKETISLPWGRR